MIERAVRALTLEDQRKLLRDLPSLIRFSEADRLRLKAAEKSFSFWNNKEDDVYDRL